MNSKIKASNVYVGKILSMQSILTNIIVYIPLTNKHKGILCIVANRLKIELRI